MDTNTSVAALFGEPVYRKAPNPPQINNEFDALPIMAAARAALAGLAEAGDIPKSQRMKMRDLKDRVKDLRMQYQERVVVVGRLFEAENKLLNIYEDIEVLVTELPTPPPPDSPA